LELGYRLPWELVDKLVLEAELLFGWEESKIEETTWSKEPQGKV